MSPTCLTTCIPTMPFRRSEKRSMEISAKQDSSSWKVFYKRIRGKRRCKRRIKAGEDIRRRTMVKSHGPSKWKTSDPSRDRPETSFLITKFLSVLYVMRVWFLNFITIHYDLTTSFSFRRQQRLMDLTAEPKARRIYQCKVFRSRNTGCEECPECKRDL